MMKLNKWMCFVMLLLLFPVYLIGCKSLENKDVNVKNSTEIVEQEKRVDTPEETLNIIIELIDEEMRVFDVGDHHEALFGMIVDKAITLEADEVRPMIRETVETFMDDYFRGRIEEVLGLYNEDYTSSDVETVFKSTSRTALYELIELYEWTFYKNK